MIVSQVMNVCPRITHDGISTIRLSPKRSILYKPGLGPSRLALDQCRAKKRGHPLPGGSPIRKVSSPTWFGRSTKFGSRSFVDSRLGIYKISPPGSPITRDGLYCHPNISVATKTALATRITSDNSDIAVAQRWRRTRRLAAVDLGSHLTVTFQ